MFFILCFVAWVQSWIAFYYYRIHDDVHEQKETNVTLSTHVHNYMVDDDDVVDGVRAVLD